jgi:hypothetical protein
MPKLLDFRLEMMIGCDVIPFALLDSIQFDLSLIKPCLEPLASLCRLLELFPKLLEVF